MKAYKSTYQKKSSRLPFLISPLFLKLLVALFISACGGPKPHVADNPASQRFRDVTRLFPIDRMYVAQASFLKANKDSASDLAILSQSKQEIFILLNQRKKGFQKKLAGKWAKKNKEKINFFATADLDRDGSDDLILIMGSRENPKAQILFNNKKGYFYSKEKEGVYELRPGIRNVIPVDIDGDGDKDLFYFGDNFKSSKKNNNQTMLWVNKGNGDFENLTSLLMPALPSGIRSASFADYDGDGVVDVFLAYRKGQNRLLINNGVGKFSDRTLSSLPRILDDTMHVDWADFDQDGDNDLLVINSSINKMFRGYPREINYFLENKGGGNFRKRSH